jgi:hypothetical protein
MTYFLRFPDKQVWITAAMDAGFYVDYPATDTDETGVSILRTNTVDRAIDVIGIITRSGKYDTEGNVIIAPVVLDGFHINFIGNLPDGWSQYLVEPVNPYRVFA